MDHYNDPSYMRLHDKLERYPMLNDIIRDYRLEAMDTSLCKTASSTCFAWPEKRLFPIDTIEDSIWSMVYLVKEASIPESVLTSVKDALEIWGVPEVANLPDHLDSFDELIEEGIEKIASSSYCLPDHKRMFVSSSEDVEDAQKFFRDNYRSMDLVTRIEASCNLCKIASDLNSTIESPLILQYAGKTTCDFEKTAEHLEIRANLTSDNPIVKNAFTKIASFIRDLPARFETEKELQVLLIKVAQSINFLDIRAGLESKYDVNILDPYRAVFNMEKAAARLLTINGKEYTVDSLAGVETSAYEEAFGPEVVEAISDDGGDTIDPYKLEVIIPTMPRDLQSNFIQSAGL